MPKKLLISVWFFVIILLLLYSFTQVDLGLTLNKSSIALEIQKSFQYIGYFNRPLSSTLAISIFIFLFSLYILTLYLLWKKEINLKTVWTVIFLLSVVLVFSYNAFSHDVFNYMFDAKIVTHYGQNPYIKKALDFPGDPYLGFMHWTHRTYPYGPVWLLITIPISFIGFQIFIVTFYLFKILMISSYIACSYLIYKIAKLTKLVDPTFALAFFSLNPLVIVEVLISSHHDLVMMAFALFGVYLLFTQKNLPSFVPLFISAGIKYATVFLAPIFIWFTFSKRKNKREILISGSVIAMILAVILASYRTTFQPWYLLFVIPFSSLLSNKYYVFIPTVIISFLILFQYIPFLYTGNYDPPVPTLLNEILVLSIALGLILAVGYRLLKYSHKK